MPQIRLLSDEVIGKIAAGEVVERPAAAIKELVENSLDAGATAVTVEIRDGGISYFRVTDNGCGIPAGDIRMAFERHATSKITSSSDLNAIGTLGFRGEALASIAAVAHVTCTTRTAADETGLRVQNDGGTITEIKETACTQGTTFVVKDLFFNTPVRLKFLRKPTTEAGLVSDLMMRLILSRPDVSFRYISQGKTMYHSPGDGRLESAVFSIYGAEMTRTMRPVDGFGAGMTVKGYVGIGNAGRSNRAHESFFINGRYMRSGLLASAVEAGCKERVMIGKYPVCVLHLTMPYEAVDVNVHPNKLEVRFQNENQIAQALEEIIRDALTERDAIALPVPLLLQEDKEQEKHQPAPVRVSPRPAHPQAAPVPQAAPIPRRPVLQEEKPDPVRTYLQVPLPAPGPVIPAEEKNPLAGQPKNQPQSQPEKQPQNQPEKKPETPVEEPKQESFLPPAPKPLRIIGTVFDTYILVEYEDHLLMIDQHAVHERLRFDRLTKAWDQHEAGQELLVPILMTVTRREQTLLEENREMLERLGISVEAFGENEVSVRSIPMILGEPQAEDFLREVLDQLQSERGIVTMERRRAAILQIACKKAVKGGDVLSQEEIRDLVSRMVDQKVTPTCPHGRPLVVALSRTELEKFFHRIQ